MTAKSFFLTTALVLISALVAFSQAGQSTAPVNWETYRISGHKLSLMMPKLPTVVDESNVCSQIEKRSYYAYAEQTVYELVVIAKNRTKPPAPCPGQKKFSEQTYSDRLEELRNKKFGNTESQVLRYAREVVSFEQESATRWVINDLENDRWFELAVHGRENRKDQEARFLDSFDLKAAAGKEIGDGSAVTLGDGAAGELAAPMKADADQIPNQAAAVTEKFRVVGMPRARYTDAARQSTIMGAVRLRVRLLENGSVGDVTPISGLPHGLTDQAISAARRLVFLPKRVNGVPVTVVQTFEYSFSIY